VKPDLTSAGFSVPNSARLLNPAVPTNSLVGFSNLDPLTGNAFAPPVSNVWTSFGWEYVWHCHILGHEDNDMMRPVIMNVVDTLPAGPTNLTAVYQASPLQVNLAWHDASLNEVGFDLQRRITGSGTAGWISIAKVRANATSFADVTVVYNQSYDYRIRSYNAAGNSPFSNTATVITSLAPLAPIAIRPNTGGQGAFPVYTFLMVSNATQYRIRLTPSGGAATTTAYFTTAQVDPGNTGTGTIAQATALLAGTYSWQVNAANPFLTGPRSVAMTFSSGPPIIAPIQISPRGGGQVTNPIDTFQTLLGAAGYRIAVTNLAGGPATTTAFFTSAQVDPGNTGIGTIPQATALALGSSYSWQIQAQNGFGNGPWSSFMAFAVGLPAAPTGGAGVLVVPTLNPLSANLTWNYTPTVNPAIGFVIQRSSSRSFLVGPTTSTTVTNANLTAFTDTTLMPGINYFRVLSFNAAGNSAWSSSWNVVAPALSAPTSLSFVSATSTSITLSWQDNSDFEQAFKISQLNRGVWVAIATVPPTTVPSPSTTTYTLTGLSPNRSYTFQVQATYGTGPYAVISAPAGPVTVATTP
jgi:hypothetical protein